MTRVLDAYSRHMRARGLAPSTRRAYLAVARRFLVHLGGKPITKATRRDVERYLAVRSKTLASATQADEHYKLAAFLVALVTLEILRANPAEHLPRKHVPERAPLVMSEATVAKLLKAAAGDLRDRALVEIAYGLGLRASEIAALKVVDLSLREGTLLVHRVKRGGEAVLPLPPTTAEHVRAYLREARPALVQAGRHRDRGHLLLTNVGTPLDRRRVAEIVKRIAARARRRAHPHAFRRALGSHLVRQGVSVTAVQALLGHASLDTTQGYVAIDKDDLRRAVEILDHGRAV